MYTSPWAGLGFAQVVVNLPYRRIEHIIKDMIWYTVLFLFIGHCNFLSLFICLKVAALKNSVNCWSLLEKFKSLDLKGKLLGQLSIGLRGKFNPKFPLGSADYINKFYFFLFFFYQLVIFVGDNPQVNATRSFLLIVYFARKYPSFLKTLSVIWLAVKQFVSIKMY